MCFKSLNSHENDCLEALANCLCGSSLKKAVIDLHKNEACPETVIDCSYKHIGCQYQGKRGSMDSHIISNVSHAELMMKEIIYLRQKDDTLEDLVSKMKSENDRLASQIDQLTSQMKSLLADSHTSSKKINPPIFKFVLKLFNIAIF